MFGKRTIPRPFLIALLSLGATACDSMYTTFAPRFPGAARQPTSPERVQVLVTGRPTCQYEVIGTVFTHSEESFAKAAAAVGGDGVYDSECEVRGENHQIFVPDKDALKGPAIPGKGAPSEPLAFNTSVARCAARVFVCKGSR